MEGKVRDGGNLNMKDLTPKFLSHLELKGRRECRIKEKTWQIKTLM